MKVADKIDKAFFWNSIYSMRKVLKQMNGGI